MKMFKLNKNKKINSGLAQLVGGTFLVTMMLSGCTESQLDRLSYVGKEPPMQKAEDPTKKEGYAPITWPMPEGKIRVIRTSNSLWTDGNRTFFKDQRARNVGDILMVKVVIKENAKIENKTEVKRDAKDDVDLPGLFGMESKIFDALPGDVTSPTDILKVTSARETTGDGTIERKEDITTEVAAVVTQVLPNGNLVINGTQEVRVNFEVRQLTVTGIIRPEDISESNSIDLNQIAEARISYGGKGLITDIQQPRLGHQIVDILSPF
jgi:flagellar L-ring protein precursor FlgH